MGGLAWALLGAAPALAGQAGGLHVDRVRGFELRPPAGWVATPQPQPHGSQTTWFLSPAAGGRVPLGVNVRELGPGEEIDQLVERALALVAVDPAFSRLERFEAELDGEVRRERGAGRGGPRAGRSSDARLRRALEVFVADASSLAAERGKALMHRGAQGQGSHYGSSTMLSPPPRPPSCRPTARRACA